MKWLASTDLGFLVGRDGMKRALRVCEKMGTGSGPPRKTREIFDVGPVPVPIFSQTLRSFSLALCLGILSGCDGAGPKKYEVSGTVTWNGTLIPRGYIVFSPEDGASAPDAGEITAGKYSLKTQAGKKRVAIHADREVAGIDPVMQSPRREPYIPEQFNANTKLTAEVTPQGPNQFDFHLTNEGAR
jgi:hypothetical protein